MSMFNRKEPILTEPIVEIESEETTHHHHTSLPPVEYEPPNLRPSGTSRDAVIEAAREHDRQERRIAELEDLLRRAGAEVEAAANQIGELKLSLAEERNHVASYKAERDEAVQDRANVVAILANIDAIIDRGVSTSDIPRKRKNGKRSDNFIPVSDAVVGSATAPSDIGSVERMSDQERS